MTRDIFFRLLMTYWAERGIFMLAVEHYTTGQKDAFGIVIYSLVAIGVAMAIWTNRDGGSPS